MSFRRYFSIDDDLVHLNNAGCTPLSIPAANALKEIATQSARLGYFGREAMYAHMMKARESLGKIIGTSAGQISFTPNFSTGASLVAAGLRFPPGFEILTIDQEYSSNAYVWHWLAKRQGGKVVVHPSEENLSINWDHFISKINKKTKLVAISWVQSSSGCLAPLKQISENCKRVGARLFVDVIQGLGAIPFNMDEFGVDIVSGGSHKWLCAPLSFGFIATKVETAKGIEPVLLGAMTFGTPGEPTDPQKSPPHDFRKFEPGTPLLINAVGTEASVSCILNYGIEKIHQEAMNLRAQLMEGLRNRGCTLLGELDNAKSGPICTFVPKEGAETLAAKLTEHKISFVNRRNTIRLSPHAFNTESEIQKVLTLIN